jgi:hypothetical protein
VVGHGAKFARKMDEAIAMLLIQRNVEEAARATGISTQTLVRWLRCRNLTRPTGKRAERLLDKRQRGCNRPQAPLSRRW